MRAEQRGTRVFYHLTKQEAAMAAKMYVTALGLDVPPGPMEVEGLYDGSGDWQGSDRRDANLPPTELILIAGGDLRAIVHIRDAIEDLPGVERCEVNASEQIGAVGVAVMRRRGLLRLRPLVKKRVLEGQIQELFRSRTSFYITALDIK